jgi:hypothetical protein
MSRRPRGEAAQLILKAFEIVEARDLSIYELLAHTGLPVPTLRDNVKLLARHGKIQIHRDDDSVMWVRVVK